MDSESLELLSVGDEGTERMGGETWTSRELGPDPQEYDIHSLGFMDFWLVLFIDETYCISANLRIKSQP